MTLSEQERAFKRVDTRVVKLRLGLIGHTSRTPEARALLSIDNNSRRQQAYKHHLLRLTTYASLTHRDAMMCLACTEARTEQRDACLCVPRRAAARRASACRVALLLLLLLLLLLCASLVVDVTRARSTKRASPVSQCHGVEREHGDTSRTNATSGVLQPSASRVGLRSTPLRATSSVERANIQHRRMRK